MSPGMRFLRPAGHEAQEGPHKSLPGGPPGFCSFWMRVVVSTRSMGLIGDGDTLMG